MSQTIRIVLGKALSNPVYWSLLSDTWYTRTHPRRDSAETLRWAVVIASLNTPDGHWRDATSCLAIFLLLLAFTLTHSLTCIGLARTLGELLSRVLHTRWLLYFFTIPPWVTWEIVQALPLLLRFHFRFHFTVASLPCCALLPIFYY